MKLNDDDIWCCKWW